MHFKKQLSFLILKKTIKTNNNLSNNKVINQNFLKSICIKIDKIIYKIQQITNNNYPLFYKIQMHYMNSKNVIKTIFKINNNRIKIIFVIDNKIKMKNNYKVKINIQIKVLFIENNKKLIYLIKEKLTNNKKLNKCQLKNLLLRIMIFEAIKKI